MGSLKFESVYINDYYTIGGPLESRGMLTNFNKTLNDYYFSEKTFEQAEIKMQKQVIDNLLARNKLKEEKVDVIVGGELSNQLTASSYTVKHYNIPFLGVYSACASYTESLLMLATLIDSKKLNNGLIITSSHNLNSEKQFRFPIEYGAPKPDYATFTATGSVGNILSSKKSKVRIDCGTIGKVVDYGIKDASNMGAVMAPAAAEVLERHLRETNRKVDYYDLILTGDLGKVGTQIFKEFLKINYKININNHLDSACQIYKEDQNTYAGASGPVALPLAFFAGIIQSNKYHKILLIGTGSLHSPVMVNQKISIPAIAHAVSLEVTK